MIVPQQDSGNGGEKLVVGGIGMAHTARRAGVEEEIVVRHGPLFVVLNSKQRMSSWTESMGQRGSKVG